MYFEKIFYAFRGRGYLYNDPPVESLWENGFETGVGGPAFHRLNSPLPGNIIPNYLENPLKHTSTHVYPLMVCVNGLLSWISTINFCIIPGKPVTSYRYCTILIISPEISTDCTIVLVNSLQRKENAFNLLFRLLFLCFAVSSWCN